MSKRLLSVTDVVSIADTQNTVTLLWDGICMIHRESQLNPLTVVLGDGLGSRGTSCKRHEMSSVKNEWGGVGLKGGILTWGL